MAIHERKMRIGDRKNCFSQRTSSPRTLRLIHIFSYLIFFPGILASHTHYFIHDFIQYFYHFIKGHGSDFTLPSNVQLALKRLHMRAVYIHELNDVFPPFAQRRACHTEVLPDIESDLIWTGPHSIWTVLSRRFLVLHILRGLSGHTHTCTWIFAQLHSSLPWYTELETSSQK